MLIVQRFRKRSQVESHLKVLRQLNPDAVDEIVFDLPETELPLEADEQPIWLPQAPLLIQPLNLPRIFK